MRRSARPRDEGAISSRGGRGRAPADGARKSLSTPRGSILIEILGVTVMDAEERAQKQMNIKYRCGEHHGEAKVSCSPFDETDGEEVERVLDELRAVIGEANHWDPNLIEILAASEAVDLPEDERGLPASCASPCSSSSAKKVACVVKGLRGLAARISSTCAPRRSARHRPRSRPPPLAVGSPKHQHLYFDPAFGDPDSPV